ncbi:MAG: hypothetical protein A49_10280 [Methyloceanibacter sp.]|nr:MAG: hypothetical protein A49_10280 [Methyloceanibacter sp.]
MPLIVIDKPPGLVVHPGAGQPDGTLVNALLAHCGKSLSGIGGVARPGIVHRLDKDTSGLMVAAKTDQAHRALADQFADHGRTGEMARGYLALVWGAPSRPHGTIEAPIGRHPASRTKMAVVPEDKGRHAATHWRLVETYGGHASLKDRAGMSGRAPVASLVECMLETGRTHQVRVHMAHAGHPLVGDPLYGTGFKPSCGRCPNLSRKPSFRSTAKRSTRRIWPSSIRCPGPYWNLTVHSLTISAKLCDNSSNCDRGPLSCLSETSYRRTRRGTFLKG